MNENLLTILIAVPVAIAFIATVVKMAIDKKRGKHTCSCGGNCSMCHGACSIGNQNDSERQ